MHTHTCSCGTKYQSDDPDPYFCEACVTERKRVAVEVDARQAMLGRMERPMSDLQAFDAMSDGRGFAKASDVL